MKTGVIVYAAGPAPADWTETDAFAFSRSALQADAVEIITEKTGHFDIADAWFALTVRGMARISCKLAAFDTDGRLSLMDREMRLAG